MCYQSCNLSIFHHLCHKILYPCFAQHTSLSQTIKNRKILKNTIFLQGVITQKYIKLIEVQCNVLFLSVLLLNWLSKIWKKESLECGGMHIFEL